MHVNVRFEEVHVRVPKTTEDHEVQDRNMDMLEFRWRLHIEFLNHVLVNN